MNLNKKTWLLHYAQVAFRNLQESIAWSSIHESAPPSNILRKITKKYFVITIQCTWNFLLEHDILKIEFLGPSFISDIEDLEKILY